jgi:hypothetical protein
MLGACLVWTATLSLLLSVTPGPGKDKGAGQPKDAGQAKDIGKDAAQPERPLVYEGHSDASTA